VPVGGTCSSTLITPTPPHPTVLCGDLPTSSFDELDHGAPVFRNVGGKLAVVGLLTNTGLGNSSVQTYGRVSAMTSFIRPKVRQAQYWNEDGLFTFPQYSISAAIDLLVVAP